MEKHKHIPIDGGHITWTGETPPTEDQMKILEEIAVLVKNNVPGNKYQISHEHYQGDVVLTYRVDGVLCVAECHVDAWKAHQVGWLLTKLAHESVVNDKAQMDKWRLKAYHLKVDVTFDLFYQRYPTKRDKKKAERYWNRMKKAEQVKAYNYVFTYLKSLRPGVEAKYPGTYLNSEVWND